MSGHALPYSLENQVDSPFLVFGDRSRSRTHLVHPIWLRERSIESEMIDQGNRQRLYDPADLPSNLRALSITPEGAPDAISGGQRVRVQWSDLHSQYVDLHRIAVELGWEADPEAPPAPIAWSAPPDPFPTCPFPEATDDAGHLRALEMFWTWGFVILTGTPTDPGSLESLARRFGIIRNTNFGLLFDVVAVPNPVDLAYTPMELTAHSDNPYRRPVPQIQMLHCLKNDAGGGASTLADGLAAHETLAHLDPAGHRTLCSVPVTFRYLGGDDTFVARSTIIETDSWGSFVGMRNADRHDYVDAVDPDTLTQFYRARTMLRQLLNDADRKAEFTLQPGDLMMMDNRRLVHGRTAYSLETGSRHLQGCYIDYDQPDGMWRTLQRKML